MTGLHVDYSEAYGDLNELLRSSTYAADEEQVPPTVVEYGRMVLRKTEGILPPPEVVGLEDGTLSLLWELDDGFVAIDIRNHRFGASVRRSGETVLLFNGSVSELSDAVPSLAEMRAR